MMSTATVVGLGAGKRLLSASLYYSDVADKLLSSSVNDYGQAVAAASKKNIIAAKKSSSSSADSFLSNRHHNASISALKEHVNAASTSAVKELELSGAELWVQKLMIHTEEEEEQDASSYPVEALLLLQKSMLEKQWTLSPEAVLVTTHKVKENIHKQIHRTAAPKRSARCRRINNRKRLANQSSSNMQLKAYSRHLKYNVNRELLQKHSKGYVKGLSSDKLLTHSEVVKLSKLIKAGLVLEDQKLRLKERLGCEPSEEQLATSLRISRAELQLKQIECTLAREKLAMSNVRLVMSIAQKYDNMGAEMADLIQGGLIGLLRGIEKFDSSKGFKISTYVYWWIRQGVSRALVESSRTLRLPTHLHERLSLIRKAKMNLEERGISPTMDRIAARLNMSQEKVKNATEAISKVFSLDRDAFPSLNGLPGETLHSYIADNRPENNPWHGIDEWALKDEVDRLISTTLRQRESDIVRLYYGLDNECLTWEDISKRMGLSRERVRQVGLIALEKLKHAARKRRLDAMLLKH